MSLKIKDWLKKPESHRLYSEGLALFRVYGAAKYPKLLKRLEAGYFGSNMPDMVYHLQKLASELPDDGEIVVKEVKVVVHEVEEEVVLPSKPKSIVYKPGDDNPIFGLQRKLKTAMHGRMKLSQSLHDCHSDEERAYVCDKIRNQTKVVRELQSDLVYLKKHGELPIKEELPKWELATTHPALLKQSHQVRNHIRAVELSIKGISAKIGKQVNFKLQKKLEGKEELLQELAIRKQIIIKAINGYKKKQK